MLEWMAIFEGRIADYESRYEYNEVLVGIHILPTKMSKFHK